MLDRENKYRRIVAMETNRIVFSYVRDINNRQAIETIAAVYVRGAPMTLEKEEVTQQSIIMTRNMVDARNKKYTM
jgi:hypothetical protein